MQTERDLKRGERVLGREGERPESPFGGLPISELAILVGLIASVIGFIQGGGPALIVGLIVCALGVIEVTAREHFSGYRSHTALLAAIPSVALEAGVVLAFKAQPARGAGAGRGAGVRGAVLVAAPPVPHRPAGAGRPDAHAHAGLAELDRLAGGRFRSASVRRPGDRPRCRPARRAATG